MRFSFGLGFFEGNSEILLDRCKSNSIIEEVVEDVQWPLMVTG